MPKPSERTKKKKFRRTPGGRVAIHYSGGKPGKHSCAICGSILHGMPHGKSVSKLGKLSKSEKRPEAIFAGTLCSKCRTAAVENAVKVREGFKELNKVALDSRGYVEALIKKMGD